MEDVPMEKILLRLFAIAFLLGSLDLLGAQTLQSSQKEAGPCTLPVGAQTCSYSALNGSCTITINRLHPISTPTIYARRGSVITVEVEHPSPFENLYLDLKSATGQGAPDQFSSGFSNLTGALSSFQIVLPQAMKNEMNAEVKGPAGAPPPPRSVPDILKDQDKLKKDMDDALGKSLKSAQNAIRRIHDVEQPLPVEACAESTSAGVSDWLNTTNWKKDVKESLTKAINDLNQTQFQSRLDELQGEIDQIAHSTSDRDYALLKDNQDNLGGELNLIGGNQKKFEALIEVSQSNDILLTGSKLSFIIRDVQPHDKDLEVQVWNLDYVNKLSAVAKRVSGDKYIDPESAALSGIGDQDNKQTISTVNVQFQPDSRFEISTGLIVPATPYHSFSAVQAQGASSPTIQQNDTYTIVPAAFFNILLGKERVAGKQRVAMFASGAVGYTPATSSVALAPGLCFSWRSIVVGALADVSRDVKLAGNWTVGQSLGSVSAPMTTNVWDVKPAFGLSVRIPLGGGNH
jgi:hypothetical protein